MLRYRYYTVPITSKMEINSLMLHKLSPDEYEHLCGKIQTYLVDLLVIIGVWVIYSMAGFLINMMFFGPEITQMVKYLIVGASLVLSCATVFVWIACKKYEVNRYRFIYWWVVLFGYPLPVRKILNDEEIMDFLSYNSSSIKDTLHAKIKSSHAGLYVFHCEVQLGGNRDDVFLDLPVYFASKKSALICSLNR